MVDYNDQFLSTYIQSPLPTDFSDLTFSLLACIVVNLSISTYDLHLAMFQYNR